MSKNAQLSATDRTMRTVFVGNINYDVTEDQVRQILVQAGPIVSFNIVRDRETGRPKGFGFCEFVEPQIADSAIRNLNGFEIGGRPLRIDSAANGERSAEETQQLQSVLTGQVEESPYGPEPEAGKAPEAIARTVASLPPERMFELMKEMKECVNNNPSMARHLLQSNPQLAYALLQAQVVMRVVDPRVAISMLHRETPAHVRPFHTEFSGPAPGVAPQMPVPQQPSSYGAAGPGFMAHPIPGGPQIATQVRGPPPGYNRPPHPPISTTTTMPPQMIPMSRSTPPAAPSPPVSRSSSSSALPPTSDEEKNAQLLVQVLQLSEEQINLLAPEDKQKVIELRNQLRKTVNT
uniref:RRM domain-containing protein n=1 Tax=Acrobeloides nanus TaxID=290746 RepID=A0A914EHT1_9BILA